MRFTLLALLLLIAGCRRNEPPAPTAEQSAQLNDAEDMLNSMSSNEEAAVDRSSGRSNSSD